MATMSDRTGEVTATTDENADGRLDQRDDRVAAHRATRSGTTEVTSATAPAADTTSDTDGDLAVLEPVVRGPRPRVSLMATLSLVLGVVAALSVLTGLLAGPGVAVGLLAAIAGLAGVAATTRRHVAGKGVAFLGIALGLAAIAVGVLALTGNLSWLDGDTNQVVRVHDWIAANMNWLLP